MQGVPREPPPTTETTLSKRSRTDNSADGPCRVRAHINPYAQAYLNSMRRSGDNAADLQALIRSANSFWEKVNNKQAVEEEE